MKNFITIFLVLILSLFSNFQMANSLDDSEIINEEIQIEKIRNNKVKDDSLKTSSNSDDIFGDEQTFPFVAGLGKNAAH